MKDHIAQFTTRVNSVNGKVYGQDPTIFALDVNNENGVSFWYYNTTSTTSPTANTFDKLCNVGSAAPGIADINSTIVDAWDRKWLAWYAAAYPAHTPNGDYSTGDKLPCYAYTTLNGGAANNVAQRATFRPPGTGTAPTDTLVEYRRRVAQFLLETERDMMIALRTYIRSVSSALMICGQAQWTGALAIIEGDLVDTHWYANDALNTDGNVQTVSGTMAAWGAGTVTVNSITGVDSVKHPLEVGQQIRVTQVASPFNTAIYTAAGVTPNTAFTATASDPGYTGAVTITLPSRNQNYCMWHQEPPGTNTASSTRAHITLNGAAETDLDVASFLGQSNFGTMQSILAYQYTGKPFICSEMGAKGVADPHCAGTYRNDFRLMQMLQGGSGGYQFLWANNLPQTGAGEHLLPGDGLSMLCSQAAALMGRTGVVTALPTLDETKVTTSDLLDWHAAHNTTQLYSGSTAGWQALVSVLGAGGISTSYSAFMQARLRATIGGTSSKTTGSYSYVGTGETLGGMTSATTGRLYHQRNIGYVSYETAKMVRIWGRLPASSSGSDMTKMEISVIDGKYWYGEVLWVTLDGSDLGVGRSALFAWMYSREQLQQFRRCQMSGRTQSIEMLDGDASGSTDSSKQPGVVMRNGLRVKLTMPAAQAATVPERYGAMRTHGAHYKSGALWIYPSRPLIVIG
jgi:hypothetical protein